MCGNEKFMRNSLIMLIIISMTVTIIAFAKEEACRELPEMKGVAVDEVLKVPFDAPLAANTLIRANIWVKDSNGTKLPIDRALDEDSKTIKIKPLTEYKRGETYTLYISKNVRYSSGKSIGEALKMNFAVMKAVPEKLPVVGSVENLKKLLEEAGVGNYDYAAENEGIIRGAVNDTAVQAVGAEPQAAGAAGKAVSNKTEKSKSESSDFSGTNVQVQGVDEADVVKTDGEYLYQVNSDRIVIARIYPSNEMKIIKTLKMGEENLYPMELYVDKERLIVIGGSTNNIPIARPMEKKNAIYPSRYSYNTVKLIEYNIKDKSSIAKSREIELEGSYLSSRKMEDKLYIVSNKHFNYYRIMNSGQENDTPSYKDSAIGQEFVNIPYDKISYFPDCVASNYLIVAGLDLGRPKEGANVSTYLGGGENIYASTGNLYVALTKHVAEPKNPVIYDSANPTKFVPDYNDRETLVHRFALNEGKLVYTGKGSVPGNILNQFSMDEDNGYFRIATTKGDIWRDDEGTSKNNLYVLDGGMKTVGSIEDIAPGEKIYSVRFMGDRAYMVTFKTVDPLFVIDLKDPKAPKILGALKIPGYSDYLHPYDENHIIGFGKDSVEVVHKDSKGNETGRTAYYLGMKIAIFDVTDVNNPKEMFTEKIGDRGTSSELLNNHKALLFSKEKNLMAFPVTVMEVEDGDKGIGKNKMPAYGSFAFQGAYIYNIDLVDGLKLKGKISHISDEEYLKSGGGWYDSSKNIDRILYIKDDLYTVSKEMIKANDINTLKQKGEILIP